MATLRKVPFNNSPFLLLGALIVLGLGFIAVMNQRESTSGPVRQEIPKENQTDLEDDASSLNTVIYGSKGEDLSLISAVNDSGKNNSPVSKLLNTIKFVTSLVDGNHLLFIADTDEGDMGGAFGLKEIMPTGAASDGRVRTIYTPADGYKIDRYVLSEDNKWISWYEVKAEGTNGYTHSDDFYRAFKANLEEVIKGKETLSATRLTDQKAGPDVIVDLPALITNQGAVYYDSIIPSSYSLYYGFKDEAKNEVLALNTYNSTPYLFDQRYLLFTAFEGGNSRLPSTVDRDSTRDQIVNTNIVKTYDLSTKNIVTVAPGDEGEHYKHPVYVSGTPDGEMSIVSEVFKIGNSDGTPKLAFSEIQLTKKNGDGTFSKTTIVGKTDAIVRILDVGELPNGDKTVIVGEEISFRGNLGTGNGIGPSGYKNKLSSIKVYNLTSGEFVSTLMPENSNEFEFIGVMPKLTQEKSGIQRNKKLVDEVGESDKQLKLGTFVPVEPKRERKNPRSECEAEWEKKGYPNYEACEACPVYIYSKDNKSVSIRPVTPISASSAVPQLQNNIWSFRADKAGNLIFADGVYKKIDYDFPRGSVTMPESGEILAQSGLERGVADYAYSLGFNTREVEDIVSFFSEQLKDTPYVYFSHLSDDQVSNLLSLNVSPRPEVYMSHIFYAKKLSSAEEFSSSRPQTAPFTRGAYTVVVWGSVIE